jgi:chorismate mutase
MMSRMSTSLGSSDCLTVTLSVTSHCSAVFPSGAAVLDTVYAFLGSADGMAKQ